MMRQLIFSAWVSVLYFRMDKLEELILSFDWAAAAADAVILIVPRAEAEAKAKRAAKQQQRVEGMICLAPR